MSDQRVINKTMDRADLFSDAAAPVVQGLNELIRNLRERQVDVSCWYGGVELDDLRKVLQMANRGYDYQPLPDAQDDTNFPWFLYWEISWVFLNAGFAPGSRVLDLGGSGSLFSYYLASLGHEVTTVDLNPQIVSAANRAAEQMGWKLRNYVMDMREMSFDERFDHITSICVYEHIPLEARIQINARIRELLVDGGRFSITFDYRNPSRFVSIDTPEDVYAQFVQPSGLKVRGNEVFEDSGRNWLLHPFFYKPRLWGYKRSEIRMGDFGWKEFLSTKSECDYTFGALFLQKEAD